MSSSSHGKGKSSTEKNKNYKKAIKSLLGEETAAEVISRLDTSNGGDVALTLRNIENEYSREHLASFVNHYMMLEWRRARKDYGIAKDRKNGEEELKKDILSAKTVLEEYKKLHGSQGIKDEPVRKIKQMIEKLT